MKLLVLGLIVPLLTGCASSMDASARGSDHVAPRQPIVALLEEQAAAWNRGDLDGFMDGYWRSPELVFTSGGRVRRGWTTTLERYRATYGDSTASMGRLGFEDLEIHPLSDESAWVLGRYGLDRGGKRSEGVFTLVVRRIDGVWRIVHDHTSATPER